MSIHHYFKPLVPDPRVPLSETSVFSSANIEVQKELNAKKETKKRGVYAK